MSRLQSRAWIIRFVALALVVSANNNVLVFAQEGNDPFGARKSAAVKGSGEFAKPAPVDDATAEAAIRKALERPTHMEFIETPLQEAVEYLKDFHQIEIQLDARVLEDAGLGTDTPVSGSLKGISLESALQLLLSKYELTYVVDHGVLFITTPAAAANMVEIRVYDVSDLLAQGDVQELSQILRLVLDPPARMGGIAGSLIPAAAKTQLVQQHASEQGGSFPAQALVPDLPAMTGFPRGSVILSYGKLIVVRASIGEHEAIATLLENMRSALPGQK